ncbi:unnamed protein product [Discula destructiva]
MLRSVFRPASVRSWASSGIRHDRGPTISFPSSRCHSSTPSSSPPPSNDEGPAQSETPTPTPGARVDTGLNRLCVSLPTDPIAKAADAAPPTSGPPDGNQPTTSKNKLIKWRLMDFPAAWERTGVPRSTKHKPPPAPLQKESAPAKQLSPTWVHLSSLPADCTKTDVVKAISAAAAIHPIGRVMAMTLTPPTPRHPDHATASVEFNTVAEARALLKRLQRGKLLVSGTMPYFRLQPKVVRDGESPGWPVDGPQFNGYPPSRVLFIRGPVVHPMMRIEVLCSLLEKQGVSVESERVEVRAEDGGPDNKQACQTTILWYFCCWRYQARRAMTVLRSLTDLGVFYGLDPCEYGIQGLDRRKLEIERERERDSRRVQRSEATPKEMLLLAKSRS